ncbi:MAG: hypothetical protein EP347_01655 [Alphaproteobacteria bacterium]|nr:MAG: hypothetical protein EP347_01655 [Alphaproteobacteria bacterium]
MLLASLPDAFRQALELRLAEVDALPENVQTWMVFMRTMFLSSLLFAWWRKEARIVLAMAVTTALLLFSIKAAMLDVHSGEIGRIIHIVIWTPALIYLFKRLPLRLQDFRSRQPFAIIYSLWLSVVMIVLTVSLVLDYGVLIMRLLG